MLKYKIPQIVTLTLHFAIAGANIETIFGLQQKNEKQKAVNRFISQPLSCFCSGYENRTRIPCVRGMYPNR